MVTNSPERKNDADYSLHRVRELAARESVNYAGTRVQWDVDNLGLSFEDVCRCLGSLDARDFSHSERYSTKGAWHDVYRKSWASRPGPPDDLYIKFRLDSNVLVIELCSFHLPR